MPLSIPHLVCQCCFWCRSATRRAFSTTLSNWSVHSNYYDLLGIKQDATMEEIKQAFFTKSKKVHPDSDPNNPDLHSQFIRLNQAYQVLSKEGSRRLYDSQRSCPGPAVPWGQTLPPNAALISDPLSPSSRGSDENMRYWEQFRTHHSETFSGTQAKQRQRWNRQFFGYCLLLMLASMAAHYVAYRKLEEVHNSFMDKDKLITSIYNESKERARFAQLPQPLPQFPSPYLGIRISSPRGFGSWAGIRCCCQNLWGPLPMFTPCWAPPAF
uniref:J domain-containing protein n=1 Tax=Gopherus agassizii TaxID=38772 RepID=A0A452IFG8_9SAUR